MVPLSPKAWPWILMAIVFILSTISSIFFIIFLSTEIEPFLWLPKHLFLCRYHCTIFNSRETWQPHLFLCQQRQTTIYWLVFFRQYPWSDENDRGWFSGWWDAFKFSQGDWWYHRGDKISIYVSRISRHIACIMQT